MGAGVFFTHSSLFWVYFVTPEQFSSFIFFGYITTDITSTQIIIPSCVHISTFIVISTSQTPALTAITLLMVMLTDIQFAYQNICPVITSNQTVARLNIVSGNSMSSGS